MASEREFCLQAADAAAGSYFQKMKNKRRIHQNH